MATQSQSKPRKARQASRKPNSRTSAEQAAKSKPQATGLEFPAPKSRSRKGPKLTPEQLKKVRQEAARKAAQSRREKLFTVKVGSEERTVNGAQLAGLKAALRKRQNQQGKSATQR